jgi:hypothetical protein
LRERFDAYGEYDDAPRYNIAPSQPVLSIRHEPSSPRRNFSTMRWGLIPSWILLANSAEPLKFPKSGLCRHFRNYFGDARDSEGTLCTVICTTSRPNVHLGCAQS